MDAIRNATKIMFLRYLDKEKFHLTDDNRNLCLTGIKEIETLPIDKLSRWLGFIQGYIIFSKQSSVEDERNFSREFFQSAYKELGLTVRSIDVSDTIIIQGV